MFKKLKDKLAEEVKSSPQRIQQFAQAAQAAVTSASSSITDISNSDLFSIGDNDGQQPRSGKPQPSSQTSQQNTFQDVALVQPLQSNDSLDYMSSHDILDNQRQRRLSNSSFASDVSFRLPSYETPSMYHLQSDMEVSASEAEERGFSSGNVSLDRVTKEQLYAAYRRTQERYTKYRTQYGDLARHYKLLERENAKARSVLVETQDKALRRISELREQCALEQSAKAHLEKALRIEIEEKGMKIDALNTKVQLLQSNSNISSSNDKNENKTKSSEGDGDSDVQLINLSNDNEVNHSNEETLAAEILVLNNKVEKMEQLLNKYKESLKSSKEKNSQINTELQILTNDLENKNKDIEQFKLAAEQLTESKQKIQELNNINEELQNKINVYEFNKTRELSTLELDYQKAQEEIIELRGKIEIFSKREEEYAISLAENKLSIHKELESKEAEIKSLKDHLEASKKEIQSLNIVVNDYKNNVSILEAERSKLSHDSSEHSSTKSKILELESQIEELSIKCQNLEQIKTKADEGYKCLQLQMNQETAEKLAMVDRNTYLENRNSQLSEENAKKSAQIGHLESELQKREKYLKDQALEKSKKDELHDELIIWKDKYAKLESEIQEERDELIKLQSEIEKLLANHELLQSQNIEFRKVVTELKSENAVMQEKVVTNRMKTNCLRLANEVQDMKDLICLISTQAKSLQTINKEAFIALTKEINYALKTISYSESNLDTNKLNELKLENTKLQNELKTGIEKCEVLTTEITVLRDENNNLKSTISAFELEKNIIDEEIKNITDNYEVAMNELNSVKEKNENLLYKINEYENNFQNLQIAMEFEEKQHFDSNEKVKSLENEKQTLTEKLESLVIENENISKDVDSFKDLYNKTLIQFDAMKTENNCLIAQVKDLDKLQDDNKKITLENISLKSQAESIADSYKKVETEINDLRESLATASEKNICFDKLQEDNKNLTFENISLKSQAESIADSYKKVETEINDLRESLATASEKNICFDKLQEDNKNLTFENISLKSQAESIADSYKKVETEINDLRESLATASEKNICFDKLQEDNKNLTFENISLKSQAESIADSYKKVETEINDLRESLATASEKNICFDKLQEDNKNLTLENISLKSQAESIANSYKKIETEIDDLRESLATASEKNICVDKLQEDNKKLTLENISLRSQAENIADSYKKLETEINDLRESHAVIESEKNHLNEVIEKLAHSSFKNTQNNDSQTDDTLEQSLDEICKIRAIELEGANPHPSLGVDTELPNQYKLLKTDYETLKEENRRFKSDIEGLQTYLTKISKENSVLNDKLRELIATSEHSSDNSDISIDMAELKKEVQLRKEKIDDLLRENMLLIEENLELKDQLQSQNYPNPVINARNENEKDANVIKEKYQNMLQVNSALEKRLNDYEQMNKSVNDNMLQMQEKNEKLKLSNEKLERRLDEALVSLRHLHALQENTELEYLRNILYEYLTGSGTHSVTLAKVLAAIVKFDDMQTKLVLQKEKERQGFLRQLGII